MNEKDRAKVEHFDTVFKALKVSIDYFRNLAQRDPECKIFLGLVEDSIKEIEEETQ